MDDKAADTDKADSSDNKTFIFAILAIILVFALFFSFGYINEAYLKPKPITLDDMHEKTLAGEETDENYLYKGFSFVRAQGLWYTEVGGEENTVYKVALHYSPKELESIKITGKINSTFQDAKSFFITFDPEDENLQYIALSAAELSLNLAKAIKVMPVAACTKNITEACYTRPIISCDSDAPVIYLKQDNETALNLKGNCVEISGWREDMVKVTDRLILQWYGVMK